MVPRILSISSDISLLQTRELLLTQQGYSVVSTLFLDEAVALCAKQDFDLVIIGHSVPREARQEFITTLRITCSTPILALVRPGEGDVTGADYTLDSTAGPIGFAARVREIAFKGRAAEPEAIAD